MLSKRLIAIASLVNQNSVVADIGSDHGLLPCFLALNNQVVKAYAVDNKVGPLNSAIENINKHNLNTKVFPVLADGLNNLNKEVNSVVIAGMGFSTIKAILEDDIKIVASLDQVIVSTHTKVNELRKWIMDRNYLISDEKIVKEHNKFYTIISFESKKIKSYDKYDYLISEKLIEKDDDIYFEYINKKLEKLSKINKHRQSSKLDIEIDKIIQALKKKWKDFFFVYKTLTILLN